MAPKPLLSSRASSENSDERASAEEALLTGEHVERHDDEDGKRKIKTFWARWREVFVFSYAAVVTVVVLLLATMYATSIAVRKPVSRGDDGKLDDKRNLIFMVSDGMGPTSLSMTRAFRQFADNLPIDDTLVLDKHIVGTSRTRSSNSLVTDSAAGATAFGCAMKSYNGAIGVLPDGTACGTVMEAAKAAGYMTGLVVTTRITDATPACFSAHVNMRWEEDRIAEQQIGDYPLGRIVDLILGGGRCHFLPNSTAGSCRGDDRNVLGEASENYGWNVLSNRADFDALDGGKNAKFPLLGLFAETDIPYDLDRDAAVYPSLQEMTVVALKALTDATKDSKKGFFLMVEGSRIDHAGHANDPAAQVHEVIAYDHAFNTVLDYLASSETEGIVVSTSDHETGGLSTARQLHATYPDYLWYPGVLLNATASSDVMSYLLKSYALDQDADDEELEHYIRDTLLPMQKISDVSPDEITALIGAKLFSAYLWADMVSRRAQIGWSTHGHSAVDVNIYAHPAKKAKNLWGNHENTEVGDFLRDYLDVDVQAITEKLRKEGVGNNAEWMGRSLVDILEAERRSMGVGGDVGEVMVSGVDHYHGDHRLCKH